MHRRRHVNTKSTNVTLRRPNHCGRVPSVVAHHFQCEVHIVFHPRWVLVQPLYVWGLQTNKVLSSETRKPHYLELFWCRAATQSTENISHAEVCSHAQVTRMINEFFFFDLISDIFEDVDGAKRNTTVITEYLLNRLRQTRRSYRLRDVSF